MATPPNPFEQQTAIPGVKHIICVAAGKGGVGKSTVSVNLALALSKLEKKVGLLDADIYGPSIPRMTGTLHQRPEINEAHKIKPLERYGIKLMSIGYLVEEGSAVIWRGPMLFKAMDQFLRDVNWGDLDYLIIDLPPGTGDVQLSIAQKIPVSGAITVCTPQNIALMDVKKAIDMFERVNIKIMGMVENMAYMLTPNGEKIHLYPKGDLDKYLEQKQIPKLAELPFHTQLATGGEIGIPTVESHPKSTEAQIFIELAKKVIEIN